MSAASTLGGLVLLIDTKTLPCYGTVLRSSNLRFRRGFLRNMALPIRNRRKLQFHLLLDATFLRRCPLDLDQGGVQTTHKESRAMPGFFCCYLRSRKVVAGARVRYNSPVASSSAITSLPS